MGRRFNAPNDLSIDTQGRIYFSDPRYLGTEPRELEHRAVYRIDTDGKVVEVTHEVDKPNGIALSPDHKTLYLADHDNGTDRIDPAVGIIVLGDDPVAVDATCTRIMALVPERVGYLANAGLLLGHLKEDKIQQLGESVTSVRTPFQVLDEFGRLRADAESGK